MKRSFKKMLFSAAVLGLAGVVLAGCSSIQGDNKKAGKSDDGTETILMYKVGDKPADYDKYMEYVNEKMKDKLDVKLDIQYIGWGDYEEKMQVITSSGEDYDIAFADNFATNAQKGAYADLTELAPKYAKETYDNLDPAYIKGNTINGKLYAMGVNANSSAQIMLTFPKAVLDKHNLDISGIKTLADLEPLLEVIKEKEPELTPIAAGLNFRIGGDIDYVFDNNLPIGIDLHGDTSKIINPFDSSDTLKRDLKTMHDFYQKGYVPKDAATSNQEYALKENTWFARLETQGPFDYGDSLLTQAAGRELVSVPITMAVKNNTQARVANYVISSSSKKKEKALEVINLINTDSDLLTTMVYGLEGETWKKLDNNRMEVLDAYDATNVISGAWMTGDNSKIYINKNVTDEQVAQRDEVIANAEQSPLLGFNLDTSKIKTEIANISNVSNQYLSGLHTGTLDPDETIPEFNEKLKQAGMDKVLEEVQKQYDAFLKENK
ncbi:ABC transporter substrate-binding protein [Vagococcus acidifermentans]|uniref:Sugar ABC transporter substrate-binding protein n=1 Tax=Vagococcus acidifermentans TaxID=564710 RepID=A0A430AXM7_9ENTE|nr:ABC transporter substrate-binding protein [Vagococcus acidifermentans]RSU12822.1 sugar ABC transporter substrate-binding protein [Vagococcus acidifermentans]